MICINYKRILLIIIGALLVGLGIGICGNTGLGADPLTVLYDGMSNAFGISISNASWIVAFIAIFLVVLIDKNQVGIGTLLTPLLTKLGIDISQYIKVADNGIIIGLFFILGLILMAIGIAVIIRVDLGKGSNDALISGIASKLNRKYYEIRWILDGIYLIVGLYLGGSVTIGTLISIIALGKFIDFFAKFQFVWK